MGKKIKKVVITVGLVTLMSLSLVGCSKASSVETSAPVQTTTEADLDIRVNVPTTAVDIGNGEEVVKVLETYADGGFSGERDNGDTFTVLNLPTLSTGRVFSETEAITFDSLNENWKTLSEEKRVVLGREGLIGIVGDSLVDFTKEEREEVGDFILAQTPIPATPAPETQPQPQPQQSQPQPQPQQSQPQQSQPQQSQPKETKSEAKPTNPAPTEAQNSGATPEEIAAEEEMERRLREKGPVNDMMEDPNYEFHPGYDDTEYVPINIGG